MSHLADKIHELPTTARDLTHLFLGEVLGSGMSRTVYAHAQDPSLVIKVEYGDRFQNVLEWEVWQGIKDSPMAKWYAPCVDISPNGIVLIQKRVQMIPREQYPKEIPAFFTDTKYQNFGMLGKQFVCFDYGTMNIIRNCFTKRMQKADWWDAKD